jgi:hypothetical protein
MKKPTNTLQNKNYKTVVEDWKNWMKEKQERIRKAEWISLGNQMVTVKPRIKKSKGAQALTRRDQVIISVITHPRVPPECGDYG